MKKSKIVFFAEMLIADFDGATRTMFQILNRIDKNRFEFLFVCGVGPKEIFGFECFRIPTLTLPLNASYKMALPQLLQRKLHDRLNDFAPDVIHIATPSLLGQFALSYATRHSLPVITIYHTHFISYVDYYFKNLPFLIDFVKTKIRGNLTAFYNQCDKIYVPSVTMVDALNEIGVENWRMKIWKRGIDRNLFSPSKRDQAFIRELTGNDNPVILFASRLVWEKNLHTLLKIYDLLNTRRLKYNLVIAGDGVAMATCKKEMPRAIFTGKVGHEKLSKLYASSDAFVFTSISETIGNVVLEAMASGLPCVIADGGGSKDFIQQGITGFKCASVQASEYVDKLQLVIENQEISGSIRAAALKHCESFNWEALATIYFNDLLTLQYYHKAPLLREAV